MEEEKYYPDYKCPSCQNFYNDDEPENLPPEDMICPMCGDKLWDMREDDNE